MLADWLQTLGAAGLDGFWRPVLAWTLVCLPLYAGLRLWRSAPPLVQYHAYLALLLALPLSLALAPFVSWPALAPDVAVFADDVPAPLPLVEAVPAPTDAAPVVATAPPPVATWGMAHWIGLLTLLAAGTAAWLLLRTAYLAYGLRRFRRRLVPVEDEWAHRLFGTLAGQVGVREAVALYRAPDETTPMTFGWRRPVIVVPTTMLDDEPALRLTLRHELIHVRRRDYAVSWVVRLVGALAAIHPGVWLLRRRIDQYREISCDAETLAGAPGLARRYARLLLHFSPLTDLAGPAALRMVELDSTLKKRINAMQKAVRFPVSARLRRWSLPLAAALLLIPALLAACATENKSETVIVTAENEEANEFIAQEEQLREAEFRYREVLEEYMELEAPGDVAQEELAEQERALARQKIELEKLAREQYLMVQAQEKALQEAYEGQKLKRLELQMTYLQGKIKEVAKQLDKLEQGANGNRPVAR